MIPPALEALVRERIGLDPTTLGTNVLPQAVADRMRARGASADAYLALLVSDPDEWATLVSKLVVPESWFFRGGRALFDFLARWVRDRFRQTAPAPVRVLSAPCSTGEEPYSLAVALDELGVPPAWYRIDAVDLAAAHLRKAIAGRYSAFAFREPGADPRAGHFRPTDDDRWELLPHLRPLVRFQPGNLVAADFLAGDGPFDLILCRNIFIYLTPAARDRVLTNLDRLLAPDGLMCLTPAEADRLPPGRFAAEGPVGFAAYRRLPADGPKSGVVPLGELTAPPLSGVHRSPAAGPRSGVTPRPADPAGPKSGVLPVPDTTTAGPLTARIAGYHHAAINARELSAAALAAAREMADAGQLDAARTACEREIGANRPTADLFSLLGVVHLAAGRPDDAAGAFRKALYLDPDHAEALTHMIVLHEQRGDAAPAAGLRRRLARAAAGGAA